MDESSRSMRGASHQSHLYSCHEFRLYSFASFRATIFGRIATLFPRPETPLWVCLIAKSDREMLLEIQLLRRQPRQPSRSPQRLVQYSHPTFRAEDVWMLESPLIHCLKTQTSRW